MLAAAARDQLLLLILDEFRAPGTALPEERAAAVGEAKWARRVDGQVLRRELERKTEALPRVRRSLQFAVCARDEVARADELLAITAADVFAA
jgi:hypothetical protein